MLKIVFKKTYIFWPCHKIYADKYKIEYIKKKFVKENQDKTKLNESAKKVV